MGGYFLDFFSLRNSSFRNFSFGILVLGILEFLGKIPPPPKKTKQPADAKQKNRNSSLRNFSFRNSKFTLRNSRIPRLLCFVLLVVLG